MFDAQGTVFGMVKSVEGNLVMGYNLPGYDDHHTKVKINQGFN
jgi:hypothetical protein